MVVAGAMVTGGVTTTTGVPGGASAMPGITGGCYLKKFITYDGDFVFKKVCY